MVAHPVSRAEAVLDFFRRFTQQAPDELTAYFSLFASPGQPTDKMAVIAVCHCGDWGINYERLVQIKRRYDPDNIFRLNHNIDPVR